MRYILFMAAYLSVFYVSAKNTSPMLWITNGNSEEETTVFVRSETYFQGVYITGCSFTTPFVSARLFVMQNNDKSATAMKGTSLSNIDYSPNTITSFISCGYIDNELIFSINKNTPVGGYDIIIDYNKNNVFDEGDYLWGDGKSTAFSVVYAEADISNSFLDPVILERCELILKNTKKAATENRLKLEEIYEKGKVAMTAIEWFGLGQGLLVTGLSTLLGGKYNIVKEIVVDFAAGQASDEIMAWGIDSGIDEIWKLALQNAINRYKSIELDPPRSDFGVLGLIDSVDLLLNQPFEDAPNQFATHIKSLLLLDERISKIELATIERVQGAIVANRVNELVLQLHNLQALCKLREKTQFSRYDAWKQYERGFSSSKLDTQLPMEQFEQARQKILTTGFPEYLQLMFASQLWDLQSIENIKKDILRYNGTDLQNKTFRDLFDNGINSEDTLMKISLQRVREIEELIDHIIGSSSGISFEVTAPSSSMIDQVINISTSHVPNSQITHFNYKTGEIYKGEKINFIPKEPGYYLILSTLNKVNKEVIHRYSLIYVDGTNKAPVIQNYLPENISINTASKDTPMVFKVKATDADQDALSYKWYINGIEYITGIDSIIYRPVSCEDNYLDIKVEVNDGKKYKNMAIKQWSLFLTGNPDLCNNQPSSNNATYWYFGYNCGLKFGGPRPTPLTNGAFNNFEGASSTSDSEGNFLFSTNGITVWNRDQVPMPNGSGLASDESATQGPLAVPYPGQPNKFIVFTVGSAWGANTILAYSVIDMTLDNGKGDIEIKNVQLISTSSEKLSAIYHKNQRHVWIITHDALKDRMISYLVTENGVSTTPIISDLPGDTDSGPGYMRISPDGKFLATANFAATIDLYDFNTQTGVVSNLRVIPLGGILGGFGSYGIEFSPNSKFLYVGDHRGTNKIFQLDLGYSAIEEIINNRVELAASPSALGGLQLGPDGRIYVARESGWLGVINNPNAKGLNCNYVVDGQFLNGRTSSLGLPGYISSILINNQIRFSGNCAGLPTEFSLSLDSINLIDSIHWDFGDGSSSNLLNPKHIYKVSGNYSIKAFLQYNTTVAVLDSIFTDIEIKSAPITELSIKYLENKSICNDSLQLSSSSFADAYQWFLNDNPIEDGLEMSYWAKQEGSYTLQANFINSCSIVSSSPSVIKLRRLSPVIEKISEVLTTTEEFYSYQWYLNDQSVVGETNRTIIPKNSGMYKVKVHDENGCNGETEYELKGIFEDTYYSKPSGALDDISNWGTNPNGTGTAPTNFGAGKTFNLSNRSGNYVMTGNWTVQGTLDNPSGGQLKINGHTLSLATLTGTGTLKGSPTSSLIIAGTSGGNFGNINFSNVAGDSLKSFTLKRSGANAAVMIVTPLSIFDVLTVTAGTLVLQDSLILKSTATNTARVAPVAGKIEGNVTVERYIPARRAWRLMNAPVGGTQTINQAWQEGATTSSANPNPAPGYGTFITRKWGSVANGFDQNTNPLPPYQSVSSLKSFTPFGDLQEVTNTNRTHVGNKPYMLFVRGDRSVELKNDTIPANNTTLRATGPLLTGIQIIPVPASGFTAVANPYASPINFANITRENVHNSFYVWDPKLGTVGAYVNVSYDGNKYDTTPKAISPIDQYIQSGQSFIVHAQGGRGGKITIKESDKATNAAKNVFRTAAPKGNTQYGLRINLQNRQDPGYNLLDEAVVSYGDRFSNDIDEYDVKKLDNIMENLSIRTKGHSLMVERKSTVVSADTIYLQLNNATEKTYTFEFNPADLQDMKSVVLEDRYMHTQIPVSLNEPTQVDFMVDADAASSGSNRFRVLLTRKLLPGMQIMPMIKAYPNPVVNGNVSLEFNDIPKGRYHIEITNGVGQVISRKIVHHNGENNTHQFQLGATITSGVYQLRVTGDQWRTTIKLFKK